MKTILSLFTLTIFITLTGCNNKMEVDIIIKNAKIYTVDNNFTVVKHAVINDGKFVAVGNDSFPLGKYNAKQVFDLKGKYVYPGWIDPHCHFYGYGLTLAQVDLVGTQSFNEVIERARAFQQEFNPKWLTGRGWDQNDWENKAFPSKHELDIAFPNTPVIFRRIDGHAAVANSKALDLAGINVNTTLEGGKVMVENGETTGILMEKAADLVLTKIPEPTPEEEKLGLMKAQENCFAVGLTSVGDAGLEKSNIELIDNLQKTGDLNMRIYAMLTPTDENINTYVKNGYYKTPYLNIRSIKLYADGALGSRGAALLKPYNDDPGNAGIIVETPNSLKKLCELAHKYNYQVNTHCIGDSANRLMLQIYGSILNTKNDERWRIEHAQIVNPKDVALFGEFNIVPSIQTTHCTSDMYWAPDRLGPERIKHGYIWQDLLEENGWLINGSDFPIENINPLYGFYAGVTRKDHKGYPKKGFYPKQKLSRTQALKAMTIWAAKGQFEEHEKGSIEPGKLADFVVTSKDIMSVEESEIFKVQVEQTWVNGKQVYLKK